MAKDTLTNSQYEDLFNTVITKNLSQNLVGNRSPTEGDFPENIEQEVVQSASLDNSQKLSQNETVCAQKSDNLDKTSKVGRITRSKSKSLSPQRKVVRSAKKVKLSSQKKSSQDSKNKKNKLKSKLNKKLSKKPDLNITLEEAIAIVRETHTESSLNESFSLELYEHPLSPPPKNLSHKEQILWLQEKRDVGLWVFCDKEGCNKMRWLKDVTDPTELPDLWYCDMNPDKNFNDCSIAEKGPTIQEDFDLINNLYNCGSIVWARVLGYPWWPAMVDDDPDILQYYWLDDEPVNPTPTEYHVVFFDSDQVTRAWIPLNSLKAFVKNPNLDKAFRYNKSYTQRIEVAKKQANDALKLNLKNRLKKWSFIARWPKKIITPPDSDINVSDESAVTSDTELARRYPDYSPKMRRLHKLCDKINPVINSSSSSDEEDNTHVDTNSNKKSATPEKLLNIEKIKAKQAAASKKIESYLKNLPPPPIPTQNNTDNSATELYDLNETECSKIDSEAYEGDAEVTKVSKDFELTQKPTLSQEKQKVLKTKSQRLSSSQRSQKSNHPESSPEKPNKEMKKPKFISKKINKPLLSQKKSLGLSKNTKKPNSDTESISSTTSTIKPSVKKSLGIRQNKSTLSERSDTESIKSASSSIKRSLGLGLRKTRSTKNTFSEPESVAANSSCKKQTKNTFSEPESVAANSNHKKQTKNTFSDAESVTSNSSRKNQKKNTVSDAESVASNSSHKNQKKNTVSDAESVASNKSLKISKKSSRNPSDLFATETLTSRKLKKLKVTTDKENNIISDDFVICEDLPRLETPTRELANDVSRMFTESDILNETNVSLQKNVDNIIKAL